MRTRPLVIAFLLAACPAEDDDSSDTQSQDSSGGPTTADTSAGTTDSALGCAFPEEQDTTDGATTPLQGTWGAACSVDADCVALLGDGAVCLDAAVIYELPGGYCSKPCMLPDLDTRVVMDDPACDPNGGIACVGSMAAFQYCAPLCTDDAQCDRDGYICRQMPLISLPEDPSLCLMPDCCGLPESAPTCDPND
ncbi:MAG TPA: hypothetical protein VG755_43770 [Nannocystaceae bacterium]|nr:hypothetical protein [Nannocystaceae bacterium]